MIEALANHLWQSTVFAMAIAILATAFRGNRARVRYWLWFTASLKFLIPFAPLMALGHQMLSWASPETGSASRVFFAVTAITQPLLDIPVPMGAINSVAPDYSPFSVSVFAVWSVGLISIAVARFRTWRRIRNRMRLGTPTEVPHLDIPRHVRVTVVPGLMEPGVVGIWHQTLMLPCDIHRHLTRQELRAVVAHELCHVRHRDNLTAAIHMFVEAVCWFNPAVWLIGSRLVDERERACDEEVLTTIGTPHVYAEAILNVCKRYVALPSPSFAGVSSANLRARIDAIMTERIGCTLNARRKIALALAAIVYLTVPVAMGATRAFGQGRDQAAPAVQGTVVEIFPSPMMAFNQQGAPVRILYEMTVAVPKDPEVVEARVVLGEAVGLAVRRYVVRCAEEVRGSDRRRTTQVHESAAAASEPAVFRVRRDAELTFSLAAVEYEDGSSWTRPQ